MASLSQVVSAVTRGGRRWWMTWLTSSSIFRNSLCSSSLTSGAIVGSLSSCRFSGTPRRTNFSVVSRHPMLWSGLRVPVQQLGGRERQSRQRVVTDAVIAKNVEACIDLLTTSRTWSLQDWQMVGGSDVWRSDRRRTWDIVGGTVLELASTFLNNYFQRLGSVHAASSYSPGPTRFSSISLVRLLLAGMIIFRNSVLFSPCSAVCS